MSNVLTLIANGLTKDHVEAARAVLENASTPRWLSEDRACDILFEGSAREVEEKVRQALGGEAVDLLAQPEENRRKKLLIADMDSTIITVECIDEMADMLGLKAEISAITERAMRGELDFPSALRERAGMLKGLSMEALEKVYQERIRLTGGARTLVRTMRGHGAFTALVSGGFTFYTRRVREDAGFHLDRANRLEMKAEQLTGRVLEPILDSSAKKASLLEFAANEKLALADCLAVGDGANDLPMIQEAGLGVAFHAKPIVAEAARARVDHTDLASLLYYQGYSDAEFVRD